MLGCQFQHGHPAGAYSGVGEDPVDAAERIDTVLHHGGDLWLVADVRLHRGRMGADFPGRFLGRWVDVRSQDPRALPGGQQGAGATDAAAGAGHDDSLSF